MAKSGPSGFETLLGATFAALADPTRRAILQRLARGHRKPASEQAVDMDVGWNNTLDSLEEYVCAEAG